MKKSREKIQNRGAILNFFEFVRTGSPCFSIVAEIVAETGSGGVPPPSPPVPLRGPSEGLKLGGYAPPNRRSRVVRTSFRPVTRKISIFSKKFYE